MAFLVRGTQAHRSYLAADVTPGCAAVAMRLHGLETRLVQGGASLYAAQEKALAMLDALVQRQAALFAYVDNFRMLAGLALLCLPLALLFRGVRKETPGPDLVSE
jgi:DHA2 family multidrug resistance protein